MAYLLGSRLVKGNTGSTGLFYLTATRASGASYLQTASILSGYTYAESLIKLGCRGG